MMSSKKFIPAAHYHFLTSLYGPFMHVFFGRLFRKIAKLIDLKADETLLDVGCGSGNLLQILHKKYPKSKLAGLDIDPKILKIARRNLPEGIELFKSTAATLPFSNHSLEVVTSTFMIHHMETHDKENMIKEIHRILKPNGHFFLFDYAPPTTFFAKIFVFLFRKAEHLDDALEGKYKMWIRQAGFREIRTMHKAYGMMELIKSTK